MDGNPNPRGAEQMLDELRVPSATTTVFTEPSFAPPSSWGESVRLVGRPITTVTPAASGLGRPELIAELRPGRVIDLGPKLTFPPRPPPGGLVRRDTELSPAIVSLLTDRPG